MTSLHDSKQLGAAQLLWLTCKDQHFQLVLLLHILHQQDHPQFPFVHSLCSVKVLLQLLLLLDPRHLRHYLQLLKNEHKSMKISPDYIHAYNQGKVCIRANSGSSGRSLSQFV